LLCSEIIDGSSKILSVEFKLTIAFGVNIEMLSEMRVVAAQSCRTGKRMKVC